jgi:hypothetical protein
MYPHYVVLECNGEEAQVSSVKFLNIEEDDYGRDTLTFECPICGASHKAVVFYRK